MKIGLMLPIGQQELLAGPDESISGSVDEIADALAGYEALGVSHLIVHLWPRTVEAVEQLGSAAAIAREKAAARGAAV